MLGERLTAPLLSEIERSNQILSRWVDKKKNALESSDEKYKQEVEQHVCTIYSLKEGKTQLENAREYHNNLKMQQQKQLENVSNETKQLSTQKQELHKLYQNAELEEEREKIRLASVRLELDGIHKKLDNTINDLSQGMTKYTSLGLEFQRSQGESMKFIFTQIDPKQHSRQFSFTIFVDSDDLYNLVETAPILDSIFCVNTVQMLNQDNDIGKFVFRMRQAFIKYVSRE